MGGGGNANALAQAQEMLAKAQAELATTNIEGSSGGGAVRVTMSGEQKITGIQLSPDVVDPDDVEMLEDLVVAAVTEALKAAQELQTQKMGAVTGGLDLGALGGMLG